MRPERASVTSLSSCCTSLRPKTLASGGGRVWLRSSGLRSEATEKSPALVASRKRPRSRASVRRLWPPRLEAKAFGRSASSSMTRTTSTLRRRLQSWVRRRPKGRGPSRGSGTSVHAPLVDKSAKPKKVAAAAQATEKSPVCDQKEPRTRTFARRLWPPLRYETGAAGQC